MAHVLIDFVVFALSISVCTASNSSLFRSGEVYAAPTNCERMPDSKLEVYFGWPAFLSCDDLYLNRTEYQLRYRTVGPTDNIATCTIRVLPSAEVLSNKTYDVSSDPVDYMRDEALVLNVTEELLSIYVIKYEVDSYCLYQVVELNKTQLPTPDCNGPPKVRNNVSAYVGAQLIFKCKESDESDLFWHSSLFNWRWTFNCDDVLPKNAIPMGNELQLVNVGYENVGTFMCYAEHNGKESASVQFDLCIHYKWTINKPITVHCHDVAVRLGKDVTIECSADVGLFHVHPTFINGAWYRGQNLTEEICKCVEGQIRNCIIEAERSRIQCTMISSIFEDECYKVEPTEPQRQNNYTIKLMIKNVSTSDFGMYRLEFGFLKDLHDTNVTLHRDTTDERLTRITGVAVAACFLALILLVFVLCQWRKYDILWFWKKNFGPNEKEFLTYTAYFAYYYDGERIEQKSMKQTKKIVEKLHDFMNKFGGTVFDEHRDPNVQKLDSNNILQVQSECHRIILIISPGFITDEWSRIVTDFSLKEVIESGRKAIFITMPGTEEAISILDEKSKRTLVAAMKRNITIHWDGKIPLSGSFRRRLEYALPKLPKPVYNRYPSDSSQAQLTDYNKNAGRYVGTSNGGDEKRFNYVV